MLITAIKKQQNQDDVDKNCGKRIKEETRRTQKSFEVECIMGKNNRQNGSIIHLITLLVLLVDATTAFQLPQQHARQQKQQHDNIRITPT